MASQSPVEKKRYRARAGGDIPTLPPFTGTLVFTPSYKRTRKCEPLVLASTKSGTAALRPDASGESALPWSPKRTLVGGYPNAEGNAGERNDAQSARAGSVEGSVGFESAVERGSIRGSRRTRAEMEGEKAAVIVAAERLVHEVMGGRDSSHDAFHALRVRDLALSLASEEGLRLSSFPVVRFQLLLSPALAPFAASRRFQMLLEASRG